MTWLAQQKQEALADWINRTKTPMLSTKTDGTILWVNEAFEELLGYTDVELVGHKTWKDITQPGEELEYDEQLAMQCEIGTRSDYQLQKHYVSKSGTPILVVIDVLRYPQHGEFQFFLVACIPVHRGVEAAMSQLLDMRAMLLALMDAKPTGLTMDKAATFAKEHPIVAGVAITLLAVLLFGERVLEIMKTFGLQIGSGP